VVKSGASGDPPADNNNFGARLHNELQLDFCHNGQSLQGQVNRAHAVSDLKKQIILFLEDSNQDLLYLT
jgi:hypothetical protein